MVPVYWTCQACRTVEREISVPERRPQEDVVVWMRQVQVHVSTAHAIRSRHCRGQTFDLKIPMKSRDSRVGEAVRH